ncbi:MAG: hypothetical protein C0484_03220 [Rhodospirillum sp.]|nr:hypothetical protein [Rhodospirillum sp.]
MKTRESNFYGLEKEILALKKPGQRLDEAAKERASRFSERAAAIERLRQARLARARPEDTASEKATSDSKPIV